MVWGSDVYDVLMGWLEVVVFDIWLVVVMSFGVAREYVLWCLPFCLLPCVSNNLLFGVLLDGLIFGGLGVDLWLVLELRTLC